MSWRTILIEYGHIDISDFGVNLSEIVFLDNQPCYKQLPIMEDYYVPENSSIWQLFDCDMPKKLWEIADLLPPKFTEWVDSITRLDPGNTVPYHYDKHYKIKQTAEFMEHGGETARYLVFLEDWKSGHYFEIDNKPFVNWKEGDWVKFGQGDWHLAGNSGVEPFYTFQVTVLTDE